MPFTLPDHVEVNAETFAAIATRHGVKDAHVERLPDTGIINAVYRLGARTILRIPRHHPDFTGDGFREAIAVPAARAAGVRTPALLAFDDSLDLVPVPYTVYERVPGVPFESLNLDPADAADLWRQHGRNLARAHVGVPLAGAVTGLKEKTCKTDLMELVEQRAEEGWLSPLDARWLAPWLERLAPAVSAPLPVRFLHGDIQATNVMVSGDPIGYEAVIDWGSAAIGDPALDFAGAPLRAVPFMLEGHRQVAPPDGEATIEARIVWYHLHFALLFLPRGAVAGAVLG